VTVIALALRPWTTASDDDVHTAATLLMTLATGTANVYLGLPDDQRLSVRTAMLDTTTRFSIAGLGSILRSNH
jgi:hypothetical protein